MEVIRVLRKYTPEIVLCNAVKDRHIDHAKAAELVSHACFLSGLERIETVGYDGEKQEVFAPRHVFHYIQWDELTPDFVLDISGFLDQKMDAIKAFKSQFYDENSDAPDTPISSLNFLESVASRAKNMGRLIYRAGWRGLYDRAVAGG